LNSMDKINRTTQTRGFGLLEIMIAMTIMVTFIIAFLGALPAIHNTTTQGRIMASELAKIEMERVKNLPWEYIENIAPPDEEKEPTTYSWDSYNSTTTGVSSEHVIRLSGVMAGKPTQSDFTVTRKIGNYFNESGNHVPDVKVIEVEVTYTVKKSGDDKKDTRPGAVLKTLVTNPKPQVYIEN
jgi:hypothetical protein